MLWGVQNGADAWMRQFLDILGFSQHLLLPLLTVCILLGWHYLTHEPWRFSPGVLTPMVVECVLLAICLQAVLVFQGTLLLGMDDRGEPGIAGKMVGYLGAGIYEELLFRLILLSATVWLIRALLGRGKVEHGACSACKQHDIRGRPLCGPCGRCFSLVQFFISFSGGRLFLYLVYISGLWHSGRRACRLRHYGDIVFKKLLAGRRVSAIGRQTDTEARIRIDKRLLIAFITTALRFFLGHVICCFFISFFCIDKTDCAEQVF